MTCSRSNSALAPAAGPTLIVWGTKAIFFRRKWAYWLRDTIPGATEVVEIDGGRLSFFPDERAAELTGGATPHWAAHPYSLAEDSSLPRACSQPCAITSRSSVSRSWASPAAGRTASTDRADGARPGAPRRRPGRAAASRCTHSMRRRARLSPRRRVLGSVRASRW